MTLDVCICIYGFLCIDIFISLPLRTYVHICMRSNSRRFESWNWFDDVNFNFDVSASLHVSIFWQMQHIFMHMYEMQYIIMHIYEYMNTCLYIYVYMHMCICIYICIYIYAWVNMKLYTCIYHHHKHNFLDARTNLIDQSLLLVFLIRTFPHLEILLTGMFDSII
jgi:hypothetical protein